MSVRSLLLAIVISAAVAGEPAIDPWISLDPRHQFTCLAALRAPLDAAPDDQRLLGLAITCYVHLSLPAPRQPIGNAGPFLGYARVLRDRRVQARHAAACADLDAALPELWLDAVQGDMAQAINGLSRFAASTSSSARALHAFATRDWRAVANQSERTPLERHALAWAMAESGFGEGFIQGMSPRHGWSPALHAALLITADDSWDDRHRAWCSAVLSDACWLLGSPTLTDNVAMNAARDLFGVAGWTLGGERSRSGLQQLAIVAARADQSVHHLPLLAAWRFCDRLAGYPAGLMAGAHHQLVGLGDAARWNRDRLLPLLIEAANHVTAEQPVSDQERTIRERIISVAGDALPSHWSALRWGTADVTPEDLRRPKAPISDEVRHAALDAIARELSDTGHGNTLLWTMTARLAATGTVDELPRHLATRTGTIPGTLDRRLWCGVMANRHDADELRRERLNHWITRDPWDTVLDAWRQTIAPKRTDTELDAWLRERPWLIPAWLARGEALAAQGRWADALSWLDLPDDQTVASGLIAMQKLDSYPTIGVCLVMRDPPDLKRGIDYISGNGTHSSNRQSLGESTLVADRCAMLGANALLVEALATSQTVTMASNWPSGWKHLRAIATLRHGDFATALEERAWLAGNDQHGDVRDPALRQLLLERLVLQRLNGKPPADLAELDTALIKAGIADDPDDRIAHDFLSGRCDAGQARMWAASTGQPTVIGYWLGLQAMAEHRFVDARRDLTAVNVGTTSTALTAAALLTWLDRQTPAQLDALPKSGAIPRRAAGPAPAKRGADDF